MMSGPFHAGAMPGQQPGMHHGHPMAGQVPHPSQMMGQPMQMGHPGVSGPHGQVSQAGPMMQMQPGMGVPGGHANAHALSHLTPGGQPQQQMMQQQQQQQSFMPIPQNNNMAAYAQQQRMFMQRAQMQQQRLQQQQAQGGMPMGQGQPGHQIMNPQHAIALQTGMAVNLPAHMQQQQMLAQQAQHHAQQQNIAQQQAHQQQQHAAQQQAAQQQAQHQQQQHMVAMVHAASQGSQGSHQSQGPPVTSQSSQPGLQAPMRPATAMGSSSMEARSSPIPTSGPPSGPQQGQSGPPNPQQTSQPQQPQTTGPQTQQPQAQTSGPPQNQQQGQNQTQNQNQNPNQQQQGGPQTLNSNQQQQQQQRPSNAQTLTGPQAQMLAMQRAQAQSRMNGQTLLKVFRFADNLGAFRADHQANDINHWQRFVEQHFTKDGIFRIVLKYNKDKSSKAYEIHYPSLARYFYTQYESDVDQIQLMLDGAIEKTVNETHQFVQAERARMLYWFRDGTQLIWNGKFQALYAADKIETLTFETKDHQLYIPRSRLEELCPQASPDQNKSPRMTKTPGKQRNQKQQATAEPAFNLRNLPNPQVSEYGVTGRIQTFLELGETLNYMQDLIYYSRENPHLSVPNALDSLVQSYTQQGQMNSQQQQSTVGPAFPPGGLQANGSPHMNSGQIPMNLNGMNTHTPSPHQSNMAPPMGPSLSHQGSSTSGPSANTSPNVTGKRRRSTVKNEGDEGPMPKVKQSPRMANNAKRMKAPGS